MKVAVTRSLRYFILVYTIFLSRAGSLISTPHSRFPNEGFILENSSAPIPGMVKTSTCNIDSPLSIFAFNRWNTCALAYLEAITVSGNVPEQNDNLMPAVMVCVMGLSHRTAVLQSVHGSNVPSSSFLSPFTFPFSAFRLEVLKILMLILVSAPIVKDTMRIVKDTIQICTYVCMRCNVMHTVSWQQQITMQSLPILQLLC